MEDSRLSLIGRRQAEQGKQGTNLYASQAVLHRPSIKLTEHPSGGYIVHAVLGIIMLVLVNSSDHEHRAWALDSRTWRIAAWNEWSSDAKSSVGHGLRIYASGKWS